MTPLRRTVVVLAAGALDRPAPPDRRKRACRRRLARTTTTDHHPTSTESAQVVAGLGTRRLRSRLSRQPHPGRSAPAGLHLHRDVRRREEVDAAARQLGDGGGGHRCPRRAGPLRPRRRDRPRCASSSTTLAGVAGRRCRGPRGARSAQKVAARLIEERADDGYGDTTIHYTLPPAIGTWQPVPPATDMLGAWIGSMDPLVVRRLAKVDGPDKLTSDDYATDYNEVKLLGSATSTVRTPGADRHLAVLQRQCGHHARRRARPLPRGQPGEPGGHRLDVRGHARGHDGLADQVLAAQARRRLLASGRGRAGRR